MTTPPPVRVFYSYSHADEDLRQELEKHLSLLQRQGIIAGWHDRKILPGSAWEEELDQHLEEAQIVLLLLSADFMASNYCYDREMQRALERHAQGEAQVIPIYLRLALGFCSLRKAPGAPDRCAPGDRMAQP